MVDARVGKILGGTPVSPHDCVALMKIFFECGERNRSAHGRLDSKMHQDKTCNAGNHPSGGELRRNLLIVSSPRDIHSFAST